MSTALNLPALALNNNQSGGDATGGELSTSLHALFASYGETKAQIERIADLMNGQDGILGYFLNGNKATKLYADKIFEKDGAIKSLDAEYWQKAMALTNVEEFMSADDRSKWKYDVHEMKTPAFEAANVIPTLQNFLLSRGMLLAKRVDGLFKALSGNHVTNAPHGFSKRMIIENVFDSFGSANYNKTEYLNDLRAVIAKINGRESSHDGHRMGTFLRDLYSSEQFGQWFDFDGGAFKLRIYKVGTVHMEVHPEVAVDLNIILSQLHPGAIPAKSRTKTRKMKEIPLRFDFLSNFVISELCDIAARVERNGTAFVPDKYEKVIQDQLEEVLKFFGGIKSRNLWSFGPGAAEGMMAVARTGCLPDKKSHQFYPTKEMLARLVVDLAHIGDWDRVLEPSAGQGGLADYIKGKRLQCVEISEANVAVLKKKGYSVEQMDFLKFSDVDGFDRIVMNPPFSEGQAQAHVKHAAGLLREEGRLVAILPASLKDKEIVPGIKHIWGDVIQGEFDDTGVSVTTLILYKDEG